MKTWSIILVSSLLGSLGCVTVQPVGPMAKMLGPEPLFVPKKSANPSDGGNLPTASQPIPPAEFVRPEDVEREDPQSVARKLQSEFEADRKTMPTPPRTAEISIYKKGQKVQ